MFRYFLLKIILYLSDKFLFVQILTVQDHKAVQCSELRLRIDGVRAKTVLP